MPLDEKVILSLTSLSRLLILFLIFFNGLNPSSTAQSVSSKLEDYITKTINKYNLPGMAYAVIKHKSVIAEGAYGYSNLTTKSKASTQTVYSIASMDKQLIATCIMILYEKELIDIDQPISNYLNNAPIEWSKIKVKNLLSHTSGMPNKMPNVTKRPIDDEAMYGFLKKQPLLFEPGTDWLYSDAGFVILQLIVQHISGQTFEEFQDEFILKPLQMSDTRLLTPDFTTNRAMYYQKNNGKVMEIKSRLKDRGPLYNDLGSTITDFIKWDISISERGLLKKSTYEAMWSPFLLDTNIPVSNLYHSDELFDADRSYGYAWLIKTFNNHRIIYHSGYTGTSITRFPDDSLSVIVFSNLIDPGGFHPDIIARNIAELYLPGSSPYLTEFKNDPTPDFTIDLEIFIRNIGAGKIDENNLTDNFVQRLTPAVTKFQQVIQNRFGELNDFEYIMEYQISDIRRILYRAKYDKNVLYYQFELNKDNKIDFMTVER